MIVGIAIAAGITATVVVLALMGARPAPWWIREHRDIADLPTTDENEEGVDPRHDGRGRPSSS